MTELHEIESIIDCVDEALDIAEYESVHCNEEELSVLLKEAVKQLKSSRSFLNQAFQLFYRDVGEPVDG